MGNRAIPVTRYRLHIPSAFMRVVVISAIINCVTGQAPVWAQAPNEPATAKNSESYRIGRGDVLEIIPVRLIPKSPYRFEVGDELEINVLGTVTDAPIRGLYPIATDGTVNFGFSYQTARLLG